MNRQRFCFLRFALLLVFWVGSYDAAEADDNSLNSIGDTAGAYYKCVNEAAIKMASASSEPAATIAKGAKSKCAKGRVAVSDALNQGKATKQLTDLGVAKLFDTVDAEATNRAIAAIIDLRSSNTPLAQRLSQEQTDQLDKNEDEKGILLGDCLKKNVDRIALNSDKPARYVAEAIIALCSDEVNAFAAVDARIAGHPASLAPVEAVKKLVADNLIELIVSARAAVK